VTTAETSDYRHWLDTLRRAGHVGSEIGHVLDTLAHERPFVGHVDLAWTYSFFDLDTGHGSVPAGSWV